jgi:hypothetical protein
MLANTPLKLFGVLRRPADPLAVRERRLTRANGVRSAGRHQREQLPRLRHSDEMIWYGDQGHSIIWRPFAQLADSTPPLVRGGGMICTRRPRRELGCARRKAAAQDTAATETPIKPPTSADSELVEYPRPATRRAKPGFSVASEIRTRSRMPSDYRCMKCVGVQGCSAPT